MRIFVVKACVWVRARRVAVVNNLEHLGVMLEKKSRMAKATQALSWGGAKSHQSRSSKHRAIDGEWNLSRFQPYLHTVLEELASGNLPGATPVCLHRTCSLCHSRSADADSDPPVGSSCAEFVASSWLPLL